MNTDAPSSGHGASRKGRRDTEAVEAYVKALRNNADHADAHNNVAIVFFELEKFDDAAHHLAEALRLDKESPESYWNLAAVWEKQGQLADAIDLQRQGIAKAPGDARPLGDLALWLERSDDVGGAIETRLAELEIYAKQRKNQQGENDELKNAVGMVAEHLETLFAAADESKEHRTAAARAVELLRAFGDGGLERYVEGIEGVRR